MKGIFLKLRPASKRREHEKRNTSEKADTLQNLLFLLHEKMDEAAEILWSYMQMGHDMDAPDVRADMIFVLGSNDLRVADR